MKCDFIFMKPNENPIDKGMNEMNIANILRSQNYFR